MLGRLVSSHPKSARFGSWVGLGRSSAQSFSLQGALNCAPTRSTGTTLDATMVSWLRPARGKTTSAARGPCDLFLAHLRPIIFTPTVGLSEHVCIGANFKPISRRPHVCAVPAPLAHLRFLSETADVTRHRETHRASFETITMSDYYHLLSSQQKSAPGLDHIKHRRTRSGCYTCRSRRVKVSSSELSPI